MWYNIVLIVIGIIFVLFGGAVVLWPAKFTKKNEEAAVKQTKRYGLIALCLSVVSFLMGIIL